MSFLHQSLTPDENTAQNSWVSSWLKRYAQASLTKFEQLDVHASEVNKVTFSSNSREHDKMELVFDNEKNLAAVDKLSQVIIFSISRWHCMMVYHQIFEFPQAILLSLYLKTRYSGALLYRHPLNMDTHILSGQFCLSRHWKISWKSIGVCFPPEGHIFSLKITRLIGTPI